MKIQAPNPWYGIGITVAAISSIVLLSTGCTSYTVRGGRSPAPTSVTLDRRFTISKLQTGIPLGLEDALFGAGKGMNDVNLTCAGLNDVLCRERPDLFVKSGGIPFGVVAAFNKMDWPGKRFGTLVLYIVSLGCWPVSLEGRLDGDAYLYAPGEASRSAARIPITIGYKCNLSVFTPIGLIPSANGFRRYDGEESTGRFTAPDQEDTRIVILSEIARGVAGVLTADVRTRLALAARDGGKRRLSTDGQSDGPTSSDDRGMSQALRVADFSKRRASLRRSYQFDSWQRECGAFVQSLASLARRPRNDGSNIVGDQFKSKEIVWELEFRGVQRDKTGKKSLRFDLTLCGIFDKFFSGKPVMVNFEPSVGSLSAWKTVKQGSMVEISGTVADIRFAAMSPDDNPNIRVTVATATIKNVKLVSVVEEVPSMNLIELRQGGSHDDRAPPTGVTPISANLLITFKC